MYFNKFFKLYIFYIVFGFILITMTFFIGSKCASYLILPHYKITEDIKKNYILCSKDYFKNKNIGYINLEDMEKKGYIKESYDIIKNHCNYKKSVITKNNDLYYITINCNNYIYDLKIKGRI